MSNDSGKLYMSIYNDLLFKIKSGHYKPGDKLPTEPELAEQYNVSRVTVGHALKMLEGINLIYRIKKSGTFINGKMSSKSTQKIIPIILPYEENLNIGIVEGAQNYGLLNNCFTPLFNSCNSAVKEREILTEILKMHVDGLICYPCSIYDNLDLFSQYKQLGIPLVLLDHSIDGFKAPLVCCDNEKGTRMVMDTLISRGHKNIAYFAVSAQMISSERERLRGYLESLIHHSLPVRNDFIVHLQQHQPYDNDLSLSKQREIFMRSVETYIEKLLRSTDRPTAFCCVNDVTAKTMKLMLSQPGNEPLSDIAVTGFDNISNDGAFITVQQDFQALGLTAVKTVLNMLNGITVPERLHTAVKLIDVKPDQESKASPM